MAGHDIGSVGVAGSGNYNNGTFTISGEGFDIGSGADTLNLGYLTMTNDGVFIARLAAEQFGGTADDKVGIMFRDSTNANSRMAAVLIDGAQGKARFPTRTSAGGSMNWIDGPAASAPEWFKLQRSGSTFTGWVSDDGATWTGVGTNAFTMNSVLVAGFAVCSRNTGTLNVSTFDHVSLPTWSPPPSAPLNLTATASNAAVFLKWNVSTNATGYQLKRALVSGGSYSPAAATGATNYTDSSVVNGFFYYYVVTATNAAGESANSVEARAQPESLVPPPLKVLTSNNQIQFSWPLDHLGWHLQAQTNALGVGLGTNWTPVPGSGATNWFWIANDPGQPGVFFRLVYP